MCKGIVGFSLIEILVSLFVVSLTALNMLVLQTKVSEQQRDNMMHSIVILMATEKMEKVRALSSIDELVEKNSTVENVEIGHRRFKVAWSVNNVNHYETESVIGGQFKEVKMDISWENSRGITQLFTHSGQVNLALLAGASETEIEASSASIVTSLLSTSEVIYFNPNMGYQKGAFVIYDSYLYEATSTYVSGHEPPYSANATSTDFESANQGWLSHGRIDNAELSSYSNLSTQHVD